MTHSSSRCPEGAQQQQLDGSPRLQAPRERRIARYVQSIFAVLVVIALGGPPAGALALVPPDPESRIKLAPHRAVYDLELDSTGPASSVSDVQGRMVFEFTGSACEGYALNMRLVTRLTSQSGSTSVTDIRSTTWERGDGQRFRFSTSHYQDDQLQEVTRGTAQKTDEQGPLRIELSKPSAAKFKVPGRVLFPTEHSFAILNAAHAERNIVQARIYDGSDKGRKVYDSTAFIGDRAKPGAPKGLKRIENDDTLNRLSSWPVSISYFDDANENAETPEYELSFRLYNNGVSRQLKIDYGDFAIRGALESLEFLEARECE